MSNMLRKREDGRTGFSEGSRNCGFWKEGESMIVVVMGAVGAPPGGGANDGESMIIMGD